VHFVASITSILEREWKGRARIKQNASTIEHREHRRTVPSRADYNNAAGCGYIRDETTEGRAAIEDLPPRYNTILSRT